MTSVSWKWRVVDAGCPNCGASAGGPRGLHHHSLTVWLPTLRLGTKLDGPRAELQK